MNWNDTGFLLSKYKYNENSLIAEFFTINHGKVPGIIFGGTSKKIKNYLEIGNKLHIDYNSKSENKIGYFKVEIDQALTPYYFDDKKKLACISSAMYLVRMLNPDSQKNINIYRLLENFFIILESKNWIKNYIFWELELFKILGYDLEFNNLVDKKLVDDQFKYITKSRSDQKIVPNFLIDKTENLEDLSTLLNGLKLVGDYLEKSILKPNNLTQPISRIQFINTLK